MGKEAHFLEATMLLENYLKLRNLEGQKRAAQSSHKVLIDKINKAIGAIHRDCDHVFPDGTDAHERNGMFFTYCKICGQNDL